jgi:glycosyltransferase involved in cell wall biosynthesis
MSIAEHHITHANGRAIEPRQRAERASRVIDVAGGPLAVATLDLDSGHFAVRSPDEGVADLDRAYVLLRRHGWPIGIEVLPLVDGEVAPSVVQQLGGETLESSSRGGRTDHSFSVVVCTRNRPNNIARALPALLETISDDRELIVIDNAPQDNRTAEVVAKFGDRVRYVVEPTPGLASARNCGLQAASGKFVVFTDDDVSPDPSWLDVLSATFDSHPGSVCVSGSVLPESLMTEAELRFQEFGGYQRTFDENEFHLSLDPPPSRLFPFHPRLVGTGANMAFRTEALRSIGGFDVALGAGTPARGGEDIDVAVRLLLAGLLVVRQPAAVVWHRSHATNAELAAQIEDYGCGLSAAFSKFMGQRSIAPMIVRRIPAGLSALLSPDSVKNDQRSTSYPAELRRAEWRGLRAGPMAYRKSRRLARRRARTAVR